MLNKNIFQLIHPIAKPPIFDEKNNYFNIYSIENIIIQPAEAKIIRTGIKIQSNQFKEFEYIPCYVTYPFEIAAKYRLGIINYEIKNGKEIVFQIYNFFPPFYPTNIFDLQFGSPNKVIIKEFEIIAYLIFL